MGRVRYVKLALDKFGSHLGMTKGCWFVRDKKGNVDKYPQFENEIGEVVLASGNTVSTGALVSFGFWGVDVLLVTRSGEPVAMLKSFDDDSHVKTRICQYEALKNGKGIHIAKQLVIGKIEGQNILLNKYGLRTNRTATQEVNALQIDNLAQLRRRLMHIEGKYSNFYFRQIFQLFLEELRPENRRTWKAYDGLNNLFNLSYKLLFWKCCRALMKAHLETHLGFLHCLTMTCTGRVNLAYDWEELYRFLVDDFLIDYCQTLKPKDFITKTEKWQGKTGKRVYLNDSLTRDLTHKLQDYFSCKVKVGRINRGQKQELETLMSEEALLLAKFLRGERETWIPRIAVMT